MTKRRKTKSKKRAKNLDDERRNGRVLIETMEEAKAAFDALTARGVSRMEAERALGKAASDCALAQVLLGVGLPVNFDRGPGAEALKAAMQALAEGRGEALRERAEKVLAALKARHQGSA